MVTILAFIGLIVILWYMSKGLRKVGEVLTSVSGEMADYLSVMQRQKAEQDKVLRQQNRKAAETLHIIKGVESDAHYHCRVKREIDQLCDGE